MHSLIKSVLAVTLGAMTIVVPGTAAQASSGLTLTPPATVTGNTTGDCYAVNFGYAVAPDATASSWTLEVTVTHPDGSLEGGDFFTDDDLAAGSGSETLCHFSDPYGTYTITGILTTKDADYNTLEVLETSTTFRYVGPTHSVTTMTLSSHRLYAGHPVTMTARAMRAGKGWANARIRIEMRIYGVWTKLRAGRTGPTGRVSLRLSPTTALLADPRISGHTFGFRAVTVNSAFTFGDASPSQRLHFG